MQSPLQRRDAPRDGRSAARPGAVASGAGHAARQADLGALARRANGGPHAAALSAARATVAQRAAGDCDAVRQRMPRPAAGAGETVQRAACGDAGTEWYTGTRGAAAARLAGDTQMDIHPELAHILCCSFCEAEIRTWVDGGKVVGGLNLRYTRLFEHLVHQFDAQTNVHGGGVRNVFTEEAYWLPANAAVFAAATGLPLQNAYRIDQAFWNAVHAVLNAPFNTAAAGVYPAGMPVAEQAGFDEHRNDPAAMAAAPADPRTRSYRTATIIHSGLYATLRWLSNAAPSAAGGGTAWDALRDLAGHMRILDFAGERTGPAMGAAPRHTVVDAKFSYIAGHHDDWGPGQAADQQTIYQEISGGGPGQAVPVATQDRCACNEILAKQMAFEKELRTRKRAVGTRREKDTLKRARSTRESTEKALRFVDSATVKWVS